MFQEETQLMRHALPLFGFPMFVPSAELENTLPVGQNLLTAAGPSEERSFGALVSVLLSAPFINGVVFSHNSTFSC